MDMFNDDYDLGRGSTVAVQRIENHPSRSLNTMDNRFKDYNKQLVKNATYTKQPSIDDERARYVQHQKQARSSKPEDVKAEQEWVRQRQEQSRIKAAAEAEAKRAAERKAAARAARAKKAAKEVAARAAKISSASSSIVADKKVRDITNQYDTEHASVKAVQIDIPSAPKARSPKKEPLPIKVKQAADLGDKIGKLMAEAARKRLAKNVKDKKISPKIAKKQLVKNEAIAKEISKKKIEEKTAPLIKDAMVRRNIPPRIAIPKSKAIAKQIAEKKVSKKSGMVPALIIGATLAMAMLGG